MLFCLENSLHLLPCFVVTLSPGYTAGCALFRSPYKVPQTYLYSPFQGFFPPRCTKHPSIHLSIHPPHTSTSPHLYNYIHTCRFPPPKPSPKSIHTHIYTSGSAPSASDAPRPGVHMQGCLNYIGWSREVLERYWVVWVREKGCVDEICVFRCRSAVERGLCDEGRDDGALGEEAVRVFF